MKVLLLSLQVLISTALAIPETFVLEAESGSYPVGNNPVFRSVASGERTVRLAQGERVTVGFTATSSCLVTISNVAYTNDGGSDLIRVDLDGEELGVFRTWARSNHGVYWNVVGNTGSVGDTREIQRGSHTIGIKAMETDEYEVEIDAVTVVLKCSFGAHACYEPEPINPAPPPCKSSNTVSQRSTETKCAEEDNVNIPMYYPNVEQFNLTATLPSYRTNMNNRLPNFTNCNFLNRTLWQVGINSTHEFSPRPCSSVNNVFYLGQPWSSLCEDINSQDRKQQDFVFSANGTAQGSIEASIGSRFTLAFRSVNGTVVIQASYFGREGQWIELESRVFSSSQLTQRWNVPDLSWKVGDHVNHIKIQVTDSSTVDAAALYNYIILEMRNETGETTRQIYNDGSTIIEVVHIDFWWLYPRAITIQLSTSAEQWTNVSYFRVYREIPGTAGSYAQVFVLYQDGNCRILTFPPPGIDWIPFGSSVIIGQTNPLFPRPFASISRVLINPSTLSMAISYEEGGQAILTLQPTEVSTVVTVGHVSYNTNSSLPFVTFRSMWVSNGDADVDHISTPQGVWPILTKWQNLTSLSVLFFRACISEHNTLSPDIRIDVHCNKAKSVSSNMHDISSNVECNNI